MVISQLLMTTENDQIRRHSIFCLLSLAKTLPEGVLHCTAGLREALEQTIKLLNEPEYEVSGVTALSYHLVSSYRRNKQHVRNCCISCNIFRKLCTD